MTPPAIVVPIDQARRPLDYALRYARLGWHVLPLEPGTKKPLGRLVHHGMRDASTNETLLRAWWTQYPDAGVGIALKASGLVAVDVDPRNNGLYTIEQLEAQHGPIVASVLAFTGGGGEHRVFAADGVANLPGKLGPGVELKADGYIAVEPTFAKLAGHTKPYVWEASSDPLEGAIPSMLPSWIRTLGLHPATQSIPGIPPMAIDARRKTSAIAALKFIATDERDTWYQVGMAIHQELCCNEGFTMWRDWSQTSQKYDPQDQIRVWRSFRRRSLAEPRVDLNMIFATAQRAGWKNDGGAASVAERESSGLVLTINELYERASAMRWAIKGVIPEQGIGFLYGASQTFKSFVALDYALHRAYGMKWMGRRTRQAIPVYLAAEGGTGLMRRVIAWHRAHGMDWRKCPMRVVIVPLTLRTEAPTLRLAIEKTGIHLGDVIIDTMSQTFTGIENSNDEVADFLRVLGIELRNALECSVLIVHHTGHADTERPRGASAIICNTDFAFGMSRDGKQMLATLEFTKVKDGERPDPQAFDLSIQHLGYDDDGDAITSLAACHINNADQLVEAHKREDSAGRGGRNTILMGLVQNGMPEKELRKIFYDAVPDIRVDTRKHAYDRAKKWAVSTGLIEVAEGIVIVLTEFKS